MLSKLIKHELRATGRTMLPLLGMLPVLAILAGISMNKLEHSEEISTLLEIFLVLIFVAFFIGIIAVSAICFWMMISRFYKNLLGDEGYLMMTLPVSVHAHIWAKTIVSIIWFVVVSVVTVALMAGLIISLSVSDLAVFFEGMPSVKEIISFLKLGLKCTTAELWLFAAEFLLLVFLTAVCICLMFYAAMAVGHSFANRKLLYSVLAYIAIGFVMSMLQNGAAMVYSSAVEPAASIGGMLKFIMLPSLAFTVLRCGILYFVTTYFMKNRLNLN